MDTTAHWVAATREDGETVGHLEPLDEDFELVQPRSLLGHPVGALTDYCAAVERLVERGIGELAGLWTLDAGTAHTLHREGIVELSRDGIVVADALLTKALSPTARHRIPWPDLEGRLRPED